MIKKYLRFRRSTLCLYLCIIAVFPLIQYLYSLPFVSVGYGILIITFLFMIYSVVDYLKFVSKIKYLQDIHNHLTSDKHLPAEDSNAIEVQYQRIISSLYEIIQNHQETIDKTHSEQVEYYTMWVHQIKTPISAMRLALQSGEGTGYRDLLEQELFKIEQYVELALHYTKLEDLSSDLVIREYALEEIVNLSVKKYAALFIYKKLSVSIGEFRAAVTTDSKWLSFILEQLLSNAIKYTNQGGIEITYDNHTLTIRDTGIGIRAEDMERIFKKGFTGYNGRVDMKASGIGLYLTKKVADSLSIRITITSKVGDGTQAFITFPEDTIIFKDSMQ